MYNWVGNSIKANLLDLQAKGIKDELQVNSVIEDNSKLMMMNDLICYSGMKKRRNLADKET